MQTFNTDLSKINCIHSNGSVSLLLKKDQLFHTLNKSTCYLKRLTYPYLGKVDPWISQSLPPPSHNQQVDLPGECCTHFIPESVVCVYFISDSVIYVHFIPESVVCIYFISDSVIYVYFIPESVVCIYFISDSVIYVYFIPESVISKSVIYP